MIGKTISHYKVLEKLGEGGMGVVYRGEDVTLHRTVALIFPSDPFIHNPAVRMRFLHEARMAATLLHQNVAVVYEADEHNGQPIIVMEYVDRATLRHTITTTGPLPVNQFLELAIQICEGLAAVHERLVIHRDVKPENILLTRKGQVKIADCGLAARFVESEGLARQLGLSGTTAYMSPEQVRGDPLDQRSDIFSIGIVFYEMLTGRLPFQADHPIALKYLNTNVDPPSLDAFRDDIPTNVVHLIRRALEKNPEKRWQQVNEIITELRRVA